MYSAKGVPLFAASDVAPASRSGPLPVLSATCDGANKAAFRANRVTACPGDEARGTVAAAAPVCETLVRTHGPGVVPDSGPPGRCHRPDRRHTVSI